MIDMPEPTLSKRIRNLTGCALFVISTIFGFLAFLCISLAMYSGEPFLWTIFYVVLAVAGALIWFFAFLTLRPWLLNRRKSVQILAWLPVVPMLLIVVIILVGGLLRFVRGLSI